MAESAIVRLCEHGSVKRVATSTLETERDVRSSLLVATRDLIDRHGLRGFTIGDVATGAHVSRSALYNHFDNLQDLVEHALLDWFHDLVDADLASLTIFLNVATPEDLRVAMMEHRVRVADHSRHATRINRTQIVASAAYGSPILQEGYRAEQQRLHQGFTAIVQHAIDRGLLKPTFESSTVAALLLSLTFGTAFNEVAGIQPSPQEWADVLGTLLDPLIPDSGSTRVENEGA